MTMYRVQNRLEQTIKCGKVIFGSKETKILDFKPQSDRFIIEELENEEKPKQIKGGKK